MDRTKLGRRLREARRQKGLTGEALSGMIGMSQNYIAALECGKKQPSVGCLVKICNALDISADYLLHGDLNTGRAGEMEKLIGTLRGLSGRDFRLIVQFAELVSEDSGNAETAAGTFTAPDRK